MTVRDVARVEDQLNSIPRGGRQSLPSYVHEIYISNGVDHLGCRQNKASRRLVKLVNQDFELNSCCIWEALIDTDLSEDAIKTALVAAPAAKAAGDDQRPDPKAYEASRGAGAGLGGKPATASTPAAPTLMVDNMRKLLGKKEAV